MATKQKEEPASRSQLPASGPGGDGAATGSPNLPPGTHVPPQRLARARRHDAGGWALSAARERRLPLSQSHPTRGSVRRHQVLSTHHHGRSWVAPTRPPSSVYLSASSPSPKPRQRGRGTERRGTFVSPSPHLPPPAKIQKPRWD
jgi:hypothetical protein